MLGLSVIPESRKVPNLSGLGRLFSYIVSRSFGNVTVIEKSRCAALVFGLSM